MGDGAVITPRAHYGVKLVRRPLVRLAVHPEACDGEEEFLAYGARLRGAGALVAADLFSDVGGLHCCGPQGGPRAAAHYSSRRLRVGPEWPWSCCVGADVVGCLPVAAVCLTAKFVDRPIDHLPQFRENGHPHSGHVDVERRARSVSKSSAVRASLVCSPMPRAPCHPPTGRAAWR